jgi:hypothetical protein
MRAVRSRVLSFSKLDALHLCKLDEVLASLPLHHGDEAIRAHLNSAWPRLKA